MTQEIKIPKGFRVEQNPSRILLLDQSLLPFEEKWLPIANLADATEAIRSLRVRGAPAIALFSSYVLALELEKFISRHFLAEPSFAHATSNANLFSNGDVQDYQTPSFSSPKEISSIHKTPNKASLAAENKKKLYSFFMESKEALLATRPTAVNLSHALAYFEKEYIRFLSYFFSQLGTPVNCSAKPSENLSIENLDWRRPIQEGWRIADHLYAEDKSLCASLGEFGASLIPEGAGILTHCNTGALATAGIGTAIGAFYTAQTRTLANKERPIHVFATETRPLLQGARLTAWELKQAGIPVTLVTDSMAAFLMQSGRVDLVMLGADRICANGDTANKIGTLALAALAQQFQIPFYVVAPSTSLDASLPCGDKIPIEMRSPDEVRSVFGRPTAPPEVAALNPAFDVTPGEWITAIITETGIHRPPFHF